MTAVTRSTRTLHLPVKAEYFRQMRDGVKRYEYRLQTDYWRKRLVGRDYDEIHIKLGYPPAGSPDRILIYPWRGFTEDVIEHPHFGPGRHAVFAIRVQP